MLSALVSGFGSSSFGAFKAINSRLDMLRDVHAKQPEVQRDTAHIREQMGKIESLDDLMNDHRLWQAATKAFGLGENAFAKGLFKQLLTQDSTDKASLVNRMVDNRYKEMAKFFEYDTKGVANFKDAAWVDKLVDRFVTRTFESSAGAANPAVQSALYFQRKASEIESFYDVLADERIYEVVRAAGNLPSSFSNAGIDRQIQVLESKFSLEDFKSPAKVARMIERHLAVSDAQAIQSGSMMGNSASAVALQTFSGAPMTGFAPILHIDPTLFSTK